MKMKLGGLGGREDLGKAKEKEYDQNIMYE